MMTWYENAFHMTGLLWGEPRGSHWLISLTKGNWCGAVMLPLLSAWPSCWTNTFLLVIWEAMASHCNEKPGNEERVIFWGLSEKLIHFNAINPLLLTCYLLLINWSDRPVVWLAKRIYWNHYFFNFLWIIEVFLPTKHYFHIWPLAAQLSCAATSEIWKWNMEVSHIRFCHIKIFIAGKSMYRLSNLCPCCESGTVT